jgi:hypothetical protein
MGPPSSAAGFESCSLSGSAGAGYNLYGSSSKQSHQQKISGNHGGGGGRQKIRYGNYIIYFNSFLFFIIPF